MWPFKRKPRAPKKVAAAATVISGDLVNPASALTPSTTEVIALAPVSERRRDGHVGMQGYAPILAITRNRRYCEYCGEGVYAGERHVCWGNAEHHMATLTDQERVRIMAQLAGKPRKLTRAQLRKLYASDGQGPLQHESDKPLKKTRPRKPK